MPVDGARSSRALRFQKLLGGLSSINDLPMKPLPAIIVLIIASTAFAHGEQEKIPTPRSPTPARILGDIPDGTPPPPAPPEPPFIVAKRDIVSTTTHPQGGRTITVRQIKPIALPAPPEVAPSSPATDAAVRAQIAHYRTTHPKNEAVFLSAKVYRSNNAPPRSLVQYSLLPSQEKITFWSAADFALIAGGIHSFADSAGHNHSIFMSWGNVDIPLRTDLKSSRIREAIPPEIPDFPDGNATFQICGK